MFYFDPRPFWARSPTPKTEVKENDMFDLHYAVYEYCPGRSRISSHSYQAEPLSRKDIPHNSPFDYLIKKIVQGEWGFFYGQKSIWKAIPYDDKGYGKPVVIFIEIINPTNTNRTRDFECLKNKLDNYESRIRSEALKLPIATLETEAHDYLCMTFYAFWMGISLSEVPDPYGGELNEVSYSELSNVAVRNELVQKCGDEVRKELDELIRKLGWRDD